MRSDMAKVIVERPRFGSRMRGGPRKGHRRQEQRLGVDALPKREGMKQTYGHDTKSLNEHLGPLGRYIESQVGRPWDKVFAEICAHIDRNSAVQDHVRDHVFDFVTTDVILVDGVPHRKAGAGRHPGGHGGPLEAGGRWGGFYVCPVSGILKHVKRRRPKYRPKTPEKAVFVNVGKDRQCRLIDGRWHLVELRKLPPLQPSARPGWTRRRTRDEARDVVLNRRVHDITDVEAKQAHGALVYAVSTRPLSKDELKQLPVPVDLWKNMK
jgi:hypothetical protein